MAKHTVIGMKGLRRRLDAMGRVSRARVMRGALSAAANPMVQQARQNVPRGTVPHKTYLGRLVAPGFLSRNIKKKSWTTRDKALALVIIDSPGEAWYGDLIEIGFKSFVGHPWLGPAYKLHYSETAKRFKVEMAKRIFGAR